MSATQETRFKCDRCGVDANVAIDNSPVHKKLAGPTGWTALTIGTEPGTPITHLCTVCSKDFTGFMDR